MDAPNNVNTTKNEVGYTFWGRVSHGRGCYHRDTQFSVFVCSIWYAHVLNLPPCFIGDPLKKTDEVAPISRDPPTCTFI